jgi:GNAT superfamily N-acetyltransferase
MIVRAAIPEDATAIGQCVCAAFEKYIERIGKPPAPMLLDYPALICADKVWVAEDQNTICGVIVLFPTDKGFYLDTIAVSPLQQGLGIGRTLLQFAEEEAARRGFKSIYLCTNVMMTENQTFYPHLGYVEYDRYVEDGYDRVFYRKQLA